MPKLKKRTALLRKLKEEFRRHVSQPVDRVIRVINPILRGWVAYFRVGNSARCFNFVRWWVEQKVRRHLMRSSKRKGLGWKRWSSQWLAGDGVMANSKRARSWKRRIRPRAACTPPRQPSTLPTRAVLCFLGSSTVAAKERLSFCGLASVPA